MSRYLLHRLLIAIPTLFGVTVLSFAIINLAPGSPIEQRIQSIRMKGGGATSNIGVSDQVIESLKKQYGFDKPIHERYFLWVKNIATLNFGDSFSREEPVVDVIFSKFPVSLQFGLASLFLTYLICLPLGIAKAVRDGTKFDAATSFALMISYAVPPLILGVLLKVFLSGSVWLDWFPLGDLYSDNYEALSFFGKILDRIHHFILPLTCYMVGNFTVLTFLMKNSLLEEVKLDYVRTARAKGLSEKSVIYKHALRNSLIPIATGLGSFLAVFFMGSIIIEQIFNLDGIGLLSLKSVSDRDYNVIMGLIFFESILIIFGRMISDIVYIFVDPRIDFS